MKIYVGSYKTTIGSDEESHPKITLYKKRQKGIVNKLHRKKIKELDKILASRPNKTSYYCMSGDHIKCPEYGKKSNNCYCPRCNHGNKILASRPRKTSYYCMSGNHIKCPEYGKKSKKCYCPRCKHGIK